MKNFKTYLSFLAVFTLLLTSCSKDDDNLENDATKATLSFGTYLNDMASNRASLKQALEEIPACSDDAPAYVEVALSQNDSAVVGTIADPVRINVNPNPADNDSDGVQEYFTDESADLELDPGTYSLEYFTVLNADEEIIWIAPYETGDSESFAAFVETPLPLDINLSAGVKKYVDVEVLCFDDRMVNQYGYMFFDLETNEALDFCFFANYCVGNETHYPARYTVDVWLGTDDTGRHIYSNKENVVANDGENATADPLCLALPNLPRYEDDQEYLYYEVTLIDWEGVYGDVEEDVITGTLSRNDIEANFDGDDNVNYEHLRFGCEDDNGNEGDNGDNDGDDDDGEDNSGDDNDGDDDDGSDDGDDDSDENDNGNDTDNGIAGCNTAYMFGDFELNEDFDGITSNSWGWANFVEEDGTYTYDLWAGAGQNNTNAGTLVGEVTYIVDGDEVQVTIDLTDGNSLSETHIYLDGDEPAINGPGQYGNTHENIDENSIEYNLEVEDINEDGSFWIIVHTEVCGDNS